jgi:hypothetical protein
VAIPAARCLSVTVGFVALAMVASSWIDRLNARTIRAYVILAPLDHRQIQKSLSFMANLGR